MIDNPLSDLQNKFLDTIAQELTVSQETSNPSTETPRKLDLLMDKVKSLEGTFTTSISKAMKSGESEEKNPSPEEKPSEINVISQTLAEIYVAQGKIDQALAVYQKLCLKFPEKSSYFEEKITELKKNI